MPRSAKLALQCLVTVGVLAYLFQNIPFGAIVLALKSAHPGFVALGFLLQILIRFPAAKRMKVIADAQNLPLNLKTIVDPLFVSSFYSLLLPGAVAGGAATWMKYVQHGAPRGPAFVSILVNRTTEILTTTVAGIAYWVVDHKLDGVRAIGFGGVAFALLFLLHLLLFGRAHYPEVLLQRANEHWSGEGWVKRKVRAFAEHLARMRELPVRALAIIVVASVAQDFLGAAALYAFARALDLQLGFLTVAWMRVAVHLVVLLPVSISGLGVRESTLVLLTAPYGVPAATAVAWSFLIFGGTLVAACYGGILEARAQWFGNTPRARGGVPDDRV